MRTFEIPTEGGASVIHVGRDLLGSWSPRPRAARETFVVVSHPGSRPVAAELARLLAAGGRVVEIALPDGEAAKTWDVVAAVHDRLAEANVGRNDSIVGVGGGTVTDVAGFVAATWLRGVEFIAVPTTMLGAVDAAIGGKTGINVGGKNLVGAFWHPTEVAVDLAILEGLPPALKREGFAEAVKAGYLAAPPVVDEFRSRGSEADVDLVVPAAIGVKVGVVSEDFRESGRRALLNLGHTIGHAVEFASGLSHGEAVAVGMVAAAAISERRYGVDLAVAEVLSKIGLPVRAPAGLDRAELRRLMARDKKRDPGGLRMVLLRGVGDPVIDHVEPAEIDVGLDAIGVGG